jgi:hypothetical protein
VIDDADKRVRSQDASFLLNDNGSLMERYYRI